MSTEEFHLGFPVEIVDRPKKPERRNGKKEITQAINGGLGILKKEVKAAPNEKLAWIIQTIEGAQAKIREQKSKDGKFTHKWFDPQLNREMEISEGIPVDDLIDFLREKAQNSVNGKGQERLAHWADILTESSLPFYEAHKDELKDDPSDPLRDARIRQEANLISLPTDYRPKGSVEDNYFQAEAVLKKRRELSLPTPEKKTPPEPSPSTPPEKPSEPDKIPPKPDIKTSNPVTEAPIPAYRVTGVQYGPGGDHMLITQPNLRPGAEAQPNPPVEPMTPPEQPPAPPQPDGGGRTPDVDWDEPNEPDVIPEPDIPQVPPQPEPVVPPVPTPQPQPRPAPQPAPAPEMPTEIKFGLASAKQSIEHTRQSDRGTTQVQEMELLEERGREFARARMTERREEWGGRYEQLRQLVPRFWKYTVGEVSTYNKEKTHGQRLLAESGLQMGDLPYEFFNQVDQLARQNIDQNRRGLRRITGGIRDFFSELTFREKDLHRERTNIIRQLREAADNRVNLNPRQQQLLQSPLGQQFIRIANGDAIASEALAKRLSDQFGNELIHGIAGERKGEQAASIEGPAADFLKNRVITPLLVEGLQSGQISENTLATVRRSMQEFFFSPDFVRWYDQQPQETKDALKLSLSYGSDLIPVIQEVLLPQIREAMAHGGAIANIDEYIKTVVLKDLSLRANVGTLKGGAEGTLNEGLVERAATRSITNDRVLALYEDIRSQRPMRLAPDSYLEAAITRERILGNLTRAATNHVAMGMAVTVGLFALQRGATTAAGLALPLVGGAVVAGALRGVQERRLFTREYEQHEIEKELGYQFAPDARRRHQMEGLERHKRVMQTELTAPMQQSRDRLRAAIETGNNVSTQEILNLLGLIADTQARFRIADTRGIGLLSASEPQNYQPEKTALEFTRAEANAALRTYLIAHRAQLNEVGSSLGIQTTDASGNIDSDVVITSANVILTNQQIRHLEEGIDINRRYETALGSLTIDQARSIDRRETAFREARRWRVGSRSVLTALAVLGGGTATQQLWALAGRGIFHQNISPTIIERQFGIQPENPPAPPSGEAPRIRFREALRAGNHDTFRYKGFDIDVNSNPTTRQMSMLHLKSNIQAHGFLNSEGKPVFDQSFVGNKDLTPADWETFNSALRNEGWQVETTAESGRPGFNPPEIWAKNSTNVDHREWYSYDQPGSQGNEIRFHDFKEGNKVILDMNNMQQGFQRGLNPNPIDVQDVIKSGKAGFYFSTPNAPQDGIFVPAEGGKLILDPNDNDPTHIFQTQSGSIQRGELARLVLNQEALQKYPDGNLATEVHGRQDVFNLGQDGKYGFIEAGTIIKKDGVNILQDFATIRGSSPIPSPIEGTPPHSIFTLTLPETPSPPAPQTDAWPVPIFPGRRPLEEPERLESRPPNVIIPPEERQRQEQELEQRRQELENVRNDPNLAPEERARREKQLRAELDGILTNLTAEQPLQRPEATNLENRFGQILYGERARPDHTLFVANPPASFEQLNQQEQDELLRDISTTEPFFIPWPDTEYWAANPRVIPWNDFFFQDPRFRSAEESTKRDSGLLALSAVLAGSPESQAKLYKTLSQAIIKFHEQNPDFLEQWAKAQENRRYSFITPVGEMTPMGIFTFYDLYNWNDRPLNRTANERLLTYNRNNEPDIDGIRDFWSNRILELKEALNNDQLQGHHLRWVEFLSHSVRVAEIIRRLKASRPEFTQGVTGAATQAQAAAPGQPPRATFEPLPQTLPTQATRRETETTGITPRLNIINDQFKRLGEEGEIEVSSDYPTAGKFLWQEVIYGEDRHLDGDHCYRGYLMVEPGNMPQVLEILRDLGQTRKTQGKNLDFKWLKMTLPDSTDVTEVARYMSDTGNIGKYERLAPTDPRIAIYADTQEEIQEILTALAQNPEWQLIEYRRIMRFGDGPENTPRRPGTNSFILNGREYRSLNYNNRPGYSEDEAVDPNWRLRKVGTPTIMLGPEPLRVTGEEVPEITQRDLEETEEWAKRWDSGSVSLQQAAAKSQQEKEQLLRAWAEKAADENQFVTNHYSDVPPPPLDPVPVWERQTNPRGMLSCQLASVGNALRALRVYSDSRHSEQALTTTLGGEEYTQAHPQGVSVSALEDKVLAQIPEITFRGSNSVAEILSAVENGAAAIVPLGTNHVGIIPPGSRVTRGAGGWISVQVVDSLSGPRHIPLKNLIQSDITLSLNPRDSMGIIIKKRPEEDLTGSVRLEEPGPVTKPIEGLHLTEEERRQLLGLAAPVSEAEITYEPSDEDPKLAEEYWQEVAKSTDEDWVTMEKASITFDIRNDAAKGNVLNFNTFESNEQRRRGEFAAYREEARKLGLGVGTFHYNPKTGEATASLTPLPAKPFEPKFSVTTPTETPVQPTEAAAKAKTLAEKVKEIMERERISEREAVEELRRRQRKNPNG